MNAEQKKNLRLQTAVKAEELYDNLLEKIEQGSLGQAASRRFALKNSEKDEYGLAVTLSLNLEVI